ncbi:MAG: hydrolase [Defluviitaleaceae bacterium]|nr:hydrolase [Defluviitaleaceae bacterium]
MELSVGGAREILKKYNAEPFHLQHAETVAAVMACAAKSRGYDAGYWEIVGLLHDVDFEMYPEEHCVRGEEILRGEGVGTDIIRSAMSHGFGQTGSAHKPEHYMEKYLFAADELTGLIFAAALMRPSKSVADLETPSVMKKFKDKRFAAGCSRETISLGAEMLGLTLGELIGEVILAMRGMER